MNTEFLLNLRRLVFDPVAWRLSKLELHKLMEHREIEEIINATEEYVGRSYYARIHAIQKPSEIASLARLVQNARPKVVVEIGTAKGGTLYVWTRSNPQVEMVVSLDLPGGLFGGGYDGRRIKLYREFAYDRPATRMEFLRCDSHTAATREKLITILAGRTIDFLYIDGDHAYEGVKIDFQMYAPLVRPGGLIAFHDIVTTGNGHEVSRFWNEIKSKYRHEEFVQSQQGSMGIGVLHLC
jgi:cephalosporin hydroxylase